MKSAFELELGAARVRERFVEEAAHERLASQVLRSSPRVRTRLAYGLHAIADWLSPETAPAAPELRRGLETT